MNDNDPIEIDKDLKMTAANWARTLGSTMSPSRIAEITKRTQQRPLIATPSTATPVQIRAIQRHLRRLAVRERHDKRLSGGVYAKWRLELRDPKGRPVPMGYTRKGKPIWFKEGPSHSFVHNFGIIMRGFLQNLDSAINVNEVITEDDGSTHTIRGKGAQTGNNPFRTGNGVMKFGNGSGARVASDTELQGGILASAEGTLTLALTGETSVSTVFTAEGQVTNNTGGLFTVEEMGIYAQLTDASAVTNVTTLLASDLTGSTAVADTLTVLGRYTFTIAV